MMLMWTGQPERLPNSSLHQYAVNGMELFGLLAKLIRNGETLNSFGLRD
jgi:hypothetical protein